LAINIAAVHPIMPTLTRNTEFFTKTLASSIFSSENALPRNRCIPFDTPMPPTTVKIAERETTADEIPIMSVVLIFDIIIQKPYPEIIIAIVSR
jgi:hypothetical protein